MRCCSEFLMTGGSIFLSHVVIDHHSFEEMEKAKMSNCNFIRISVKSTNVRHSIFILFHDVNSIYYVKFRALMEICRDLRRNYFLSYRFMFHGRWRGQDVFTKKSCWPYKMVPFYGNSMMIGNPL